MFCPHCHTALPSPFPIDAARCPSCRLIIGAGRAVDDTPDGRAGNIGGASGMIANAARRESANAAEPAAVLAALKHVADATSTATDRLRLFDYERARATAPQLPTVGTILATFGTWKAARAAAAAGKPMTVEPASLSDE